MKNEKMMAFVMLILLAVGGSWLLPSMGGQGKGKGNSLVARVEALEQQVAGLTARVEELEQGQGSGGNSSDVLRLNTLDDFPENPSEGDLCITKEVEYIEPEPHPRAGPPYYIIRFLWCYFDGEWRLIGEYYEYA